MNAEVAGIKLPPPVHVGLVVRDVDKTVKHFERAFGVGPWRVFEANIANALHRGEPVPVRLKIGTAPLGAMQVELLQVVEGSNVLSEFLRERGEGLHHLAFQVDNLEEDIAKLERLGADVLFTTSENKRFAYMGTESLVGTVIELMQRPPAAK